MLTIKRNTEIKTDVALKKSMSKEAVAGMLFVLPAVIFISVVFTGKNVVKMTVSK